MEWRSSRAVLEARCARRSDSRVSGVMVEMEGEEGVVDEEGIFFFFEGSVFGGGSDWGSRVVVLMSDCRSEVLGIS